MRQDKKAALCFAVFIALALFSINVLGVGEASFQVTAFSCSPSEVVINSVFSCTATVKNAGESSGSVGTATLYPDASNWLENSNYPQSSGTSVGVGESISITFTGLKAVKSGNNGFSKIMLDLVEDKYVANENKKVNAIDVAVTVSNSASSAVMGGSITSTAEITAGGNIDVTLTFVSDSGGCTIGSQTNPKTFNSLTDGAKQSWTWTLTQGTSGNCVYTLSASATSSGGYASKIDSTSSTITCTNCPVSSSSSSSSSGGGGGAGGSVVFISDSQLVAGYSKDFSSGESVKFNVSGKQHLLSVSNVTETTATISIQSEKQTFVLTVGDEIKVDVDSDGVADISVKLKTINIITKKASLLITKVSGGTPSSPSDYSGVEETGKGDKDLTDGGNEANKRLVFGIIIGVIIIVAIVFIVLRKNNSNNSYSKVRRR